MKSSLITLFSIMALIGCVPQSGGKGPIVSGEGSGLSSSRPSSSIDNSISAQSVETPITSRNALQTLEAFSSITGIPTSQQAEIDDNDKAYQPAILTTYQTIKSQLPGDNEITSQGGFSAIGTIRLADVFCGHNVLNGRGDHDFNSFFSSPKTDDQIADKLIEAYVGIETSEPSYQTIKTELLGILDNKIDQNNNDELIEENGASKKRKLASVACSTLLTMNVLVQ